jgi:hypothetical protein
MSLLLSTIFRHVCHSTHERLAVDALRHLRGQDAERWSDLLLHHHAEYLAGCRAPDERFKDFQNHVVLVLASGRREPPGKSDSTIGTYYGGAPQEACRWYGRLTDALRRREWAEAAFSAGTLSHYFSDPFMPLNTAHSEEATKVHRALEYCIDRSYGRLQHIIEHDQGGYPQLEAPRAASSTGSGVFSGTSSSIMESGIPEKTPDPFRPDWLGRMILTGAELAHEHYDTTLQHFDHERTVRDPLAGMDQECQDRIAQCLAHAVVGFARVLERAIAEAEVEPPPIETTLQGFLITLGSPLRAIGGHISTLSERMALEAALDEAQRTGKVIKNLSEEHREIRRFHAEEILRVPLHHLDQQPTSATGTLHGSGASERFHPKHVLTHAIIPTDAPVSTLWRDAQRHANARCAATATALARRAA